MTKAIRWLIKLIKTGDIVFLFPFLPRLITIYRRHLMRELYTEFDHFRFTKNASKGQIEGLHKLLAQDKRIRFSILIRGSAPLAEYLQAVESAFSQTAPDLEVIAIGKIADEVRKAFPRLKLNEPPTGTHIFLLNAWEWMRVDLLYRYEQILRSAGEHLILYTKAACLDKRGHLLPGTLFLKPRQPRFPYEMMSFTLEGLLIPQIYYRPQATLYDYDAQGASFFAIPLPLLAKRPHLEALETLDFLQLFKNYVTAKNLPWEVENGFRAHSVRAIPQLKKRPKIQAIVPFKDNKMLTLAAVHSLLKSQHVDLFITAVDNNSTDLSIGEELQELGCEVMRISEPFNYSRLNNLAAKNTLYPQELIFFMNNDAQMGPDALYEMCRWIDQPHVGMVGARLHFPHGPLQHGGVSLDPNSAIPGAINYHHHEIGLNFEETSQSQLIHCPDAVTAAAALVRRDRFLAFGGFDEILYPIAYSDTNLAHRLAKAGLYCLYTPYAVGIHHESTSRAPGLHEDFDRSAFLYDFTN